MATSIRLAPEIERRLDQLAAHTGRAKTYFVNEMIERGIEEEFAETAKAQLRKLDRHMARRVVDYLD